MEVAEKEEYLVIPFGQGVQSTSATYYLVIVGAFPSLEEGIRRTTRIQLALGQLLILMNNLHPDGNAVVVVTTRVHRWIAGVLALLRQCFAQVSTGKGSYLHQVHSSCCLVCTDFRATPEDISEHRAKLRESLRHVSRTQAEIDAGEDKNV